MRASIFFAFGLAGLSSALNAQQCLNYAVNNLPACGLGCIISAAPTVGCGVADIACQCGKYQDLQAAALNCVISGCGAETGIQVQSIAQGLCSGDCTGGKSGSACLNYAVNSIPTCGLNCIISAAGKVGCGPTDISCQCGKYAQLQNDALNCVISGCGAETGIQVQSLAQNLCAGKCSGGSSGGSSGSGSSAPASSAAATTAAASSAAASSAAASSDDMGGMGSSAAASTAAAASPSSGGSSSSGSGSAPVTAGAALVAGSVTTVMGAMLALIAAL